MLVDQQFNTISEKLQVLLRDHARLKKENGLLRQQLEQQQAQQQQAKQEIHLLNQQIAILKLAAGEMSAGDKKEFEKQINRYIRDIDRCIAILSQ